MRMIHACTRLIAFKPTIGSALPHGRSEARRTGLCSKVQASRTELQSRSILSRDRGDFSGAERLRLTKRVTHVGGPDNTLGHEQNAKLLSLAGP